MRYAMAIAAILLLSAPGGSNADIPKSLGSAVDTIYGLLENGDAEAALQLAEVTLAEARSTYGAKSPEAAVVLSTVARALHEIDRIDEAEAAYLEVIALLKDEPVRNFRTKYTHESAWHALGLIYEEKGQAQRSIDARMEHLKLLDAQGQDAFSAVLDWMKIGDTYLDLGEQRAAEAAYLEGVEIVAFVPEQFRAVPLFIYRRLASVYRWDERYSKSEALLLEGIEQMESIYGSNNLDTVVFYEALGMTYYYQSRHEEAEQMANKALRFYKRAGLEKSGESVRAMRLKARLLSEPAYKAPTYKSERALALLTSALEIRRKESGEESLLYAKVLSDLAWHHLKQHTFEEAEEISREAMGIYEERLGENALAAGRTQQYMARALQRQQRYAEALPFAEKAYAAQQNALPPYHHILGETLSMLSELYKALGRQDDYQTSRQKIAAYYEERAKFMSGG